MIQKIGKPGGQNKGFNILDLKDEYEIIDFKYEPRESEITANDDENSNIPILAKFSLPQQGINVKMEEVGAGDIIIKNEINYVHIKATAGDGKVGIFSRETGIVYSAGNEIFSRDFANQTVEYTNQTTCGNSSFMTIDIPSALMKIECDAGVSFNFEFVQGWDKDVAIGSKCPNPSVIYRSLVLIKKSLFRSIDDSAVGVSIQRL
jgi:hypothetical protein